MEQQKTEGKSRTEKRRMWALVAAVAVLVCLALLLIGKQLMTYRQLQRRMAQQEEEIAQLREQIGELEYWLDVPIDYDYIVKVAREEIGLHYPDEEIYYSD
ncbi:MAG: septum formation initiator family protein [Clostridia bacterium]|nr:septum formation initiator family protein [Clostridia bacterium]